jgi:hypothetical protein
VIFPPDGPDDVRVFRLYARRKDWILGHHRDIVTLRIPNRQLLELEKRAVLSGPIPMDAAYWSVTFEKKSLGFDITATGQTMRGVQVFCNGHFIDHVWDLPFTPPRLS